MKKIKYILLMILLTFSFTSYAEIQEDDLENGVFSEIVDLENSDENIEFSEENLLTGTWVDIDFDIDSFYKDTVLNSTYIYYYGQWCSYCASLDRYLNSVDWYKKLNIEKREIYRNPDNSKNMMADAERLWLGLNVWVPFFIVNTWEEEIPMVWDKPIIDFLSPVLGESSGTENKSKTIILAILAVFAVILPVFLIKLSNKN